MIEYGCQLTVDTDGTVEIFGALDIARRFDSAAVDPVDFETLDTFVGVQTPDAIVVARADGGWWQPVTRYATCSGCSVVGPLTLKNMPCPHERADGEPCPGTYRYPNGRLMPIDYQPATV